MSTEADIVEAELARLRTERDALHKETFQLAIALADMKVRALTAENERDAAARDMRERCAAWYQQTGWLMDEDDVAAAIRDLSLLATDETGAA